MSEEFYTDAKLYDRLFPGGEASAAFYRAEAARTGRTVLELACGTGRKLIPIASDGHQCTGLDNSPEMLAEAELRAAQHEADGHSLAIDWVHGDMRDFDLGRTFDLVIIAANSLLHLHDHEDVISCFRSVRRHLTPTGKLILDIFNPSVTLLARLDGTRRRREDLSFIDPDHGTVHVDVEETYDAAAQVTRGRWYLSSEVHQDFKVIPLELRNIFPQELPLLVSLGGLEVVDRFGDWSRAPFTGDASLQVCVCIAPPNPQHDVRPTP